MSIEKRSTAQKEKKSKKFKPSGEDTTALLIDELRFFGIEGREEGLVYKRVIYGDIADKYTLIRFSTPITADNNSRWSSPDSTSEQTCDYELSNLWSAIYTRKRDDEFNTRKNQNSSSYSAIRGRRSGNDVSYLRMATQYYWAYTFKDALSGKERQALKASLMEKKKIYSDLQAHYQFMEQKAKTAKNKITLFPVSIFLERDEFRQNKNSSNYERLKKQAQLLNKQLPEVIKKLRHRTQYSTFLGYSKLIMLTDEYFEPFLHVIFYLSEEKITTWYAHDIASTWHKLNENNIELHYYSFSGKLQPSLSHSPSGIKDCYNILYKNVLLPFPSEDMNRPKGVADSTIEELTLQIEELEERKKNKKTFNAEKYRLLKQQLKALVMVKNDRKYHLDYLSCVAKNYNRIPGVRTFTNAEFTYDSQYSNEIYLMRKKRKQERKVSESGTVTDTPSDINDENINYLIEDHMANLLKK